MKSTDAIVVEDRMLFSVAYKNVVGALRFSWRVLDNIRRKNNDDHRKETIIECQVEIETKLNETCQKVGHEKGNLTKMALIFFRRLDYCLYCDKIDM